ncbi:chromosome replication/partitioning protein (plasmid) [Borrelia recurrentis]|uniref:PF49 plasmid partition protein n=1 Tax=Borrelia recurrentis (strain A1) TaxID=412418 RepID=B5RS63_BORRA|nr:chromosome replication/partitioning protein [Borrelia recurrentis]ACH95199.1 PF49 plasmid partition protein [Borrelia recurrentis A1]
MKNDKSVKIYKRDIDSKGNALLSESNNNEESVEAVHYSTLKKKLYINLREGIYNKIECMKILKEIKDNEYYKLDGYKSFDAFIKNYNVAKTQAYNYLKIAAALEEGLLEEKFVLENGFRQILSLLRDKQGKTIKRSKQNPIKPLRFQLKRQESYDFYKKNAKFTSFLLDKLFQSKQDLIEEFLKEFESLRG